MKLRSNRVLRRGKLGTENEDLTTMKLRSNRVLKRAKQDIENRDFSDNLSNGENGASEGEIEVCADDENIEMGMNDGVNVNVDDKGVYLGSEVLDPVKDSVVSYPIQKAEENESVRVDCEIDSIHVDCESGSENLDSGT
nr:putative zinc finger, PHD-type [Tanacetum cinerariifolium]